MKTMARVEEGLISWLLGCSSSLQISIVSAFFIIIYVAMCSLCTSCFSLSHRLPPRNLHTREKTNIPSESQENKLPESRRADCLAALKGLEAEVDEENPYECISDRAEGESQSPSTDDDELSDFSTAVNTAHTSPHAQSHQTNHEDTVYAAVNWKNKSHKNIKPLLDTAIDMSELTTEAVPPIPDKHF